MKAKEVTRYLRRILTISTAGKLLKETKAEVQRTILIQEAITRELMRQILVADRAHSQIRGIRK